MAKTKIYAKSKRGDAITVKEYPFTKNHAIDFFKRVYRHDYKITKVEELPDEKRDPIQNILARISGK
jgi:hypothetical protein